MGQTPSDRRTAVCWERRAPSKGARLQVQRQARRSVRPFRASHFFVYGASLASSPATCASCRPLVSEAVEEEDDEVPDVVDDAPHFFDWKMQSVVLLRGVV
jgi:hypothetical protein